MLNVIEYTRSPIYIRQTRRRRCTWRNSLLVRRQSSMQKICIQMFTILPFCPSVLMPRKALAYTSLLQTCWKVCSGTRSQSMISLPLYPLSTRTCTRVDSQSCQVCDHYDIPTYLPSRYIKSLEKIHILDQYILYHTNASAQLVSWLVVPPRWYTQVAIESSQSLDGQTTTFVKIEYSSKARP